MRKKAKEAVINNDVIDSISFVENTDEQNKKLQKLSLKVKNLPEKYRVIITLYYYDSLPVKEITKILKLSESAIKKSLERARDMLKKEMEK